MEITTTSRALELPGEWDSLAVDYFQTRVFLNHTEIYNPCNQRYYLLSLSGNFKTGAVVYTLKLDLFTYLSIPSPFRMNIGGIPCSVSSGGIIGDPEFVPLLIEHIKSREKGMLLFLNLEPDLTVGKMIRGRTLPTVILTIKFQLWEDYLKSLRAGYRRRIQQLVGSFSEIMNKQISCTDFNIKMYGQYLEVLKRSKGKLETLSLEFIKNLPSNFRLTTFHYQEIVIGWYITTTFKEKFYFFLGGVDYKVNKQFNTYFNILIGVVKEGIGQRASMIDLGQTAEIPKLRLGGKLVEKTMLAYHSNRIMRKLLGAGKSLLEYSVTFKGTHVFKEPK